MNFLLYFKQKPYKQIIKIKFGGIRRKFGRIRQNSADMKKKVKNFFLIRRKFRRKFGILKFPYFALKTRKKGQIFFIPNSAESAEFGAFGGLFRRFSYSRSAEIRRNPPKTHGIPPNSEPSHTTVFLVLFFAF